LIHEIGDCRHVPNWLRPTKQSSVKELEECLDSFDRPTWEEMSSNGSRLTEKEYNWNTLLTRIDDVLRVCD